MPGIKFHFDQVSDSYTEMVEYILFPDPRDAVVRDRCAGAVAILRALPKLRPSTMDWKPGNRTVLLQTQPASNA